ncbi:MAG: hypothetical protein GTO45_13995 [Candidatus Aminicenantes bacterium]|nr:hypothetical protein [Candidatus Aminicenantes bacterium]NIR06681.1 hypothetical protein [Candidatus Aminicenantes bacterium]
MRKKEQVTVENVFFHFSTAQARHFHHSGIPFPPLRHTISTAREYVSTTSGHHFHR